MWGEAQPGLPGQVCRGAGPRALGVVISVIVTLGEGVRCGLGDQKAWVWIPVLSRTSSMTLDMTYPQYPCL